MTKWEVTVLDAGPGSPGHHALEATKLNEVGAEGWELVCIVGVGDAFKVYLKRLLS